MPAVMKLTLSRYRQNINPVLLSYYGAQIVVSGMIIWHGTGYHYDNLEKEVRNFLFRQLGDVIFDEWEYVQVPQLPAPYKNVWEMKNKNRRASYAYIWIIFENQLVPPTE